MDDLRDEFIAETRETLETLAGELIRWEKNPTDIALIDSVFRFFHTVKGSCGFLELPRLERLSHAAEDLLCVARDGRLSINNMLVSAVLSVIDRITELTDALETGESVNDNDAELIAAMLEFHPDRSGVESEDSGNGPTFAVEPIGIEQGIGKSRTVRVSLQQLDKLMNGVSDLVLSRNELSRQIRSHGNSSELEHAFARLSSTVAEIRDSISLVRMQPIDRLFSGVPRLLRDMCVELGKDIEFRIEGGDVEIDREMVESLRDPLTHIIRNAVDHGIECPVERIAAGKAAVGEIQVNARQAGNQIVLEISDDGRGINMDKLRQMAVLRELVTAAQWQAMDEDARLSMIFAPGLSTAENVTAISGRGVGMDVVRNNLEAVGATIKLKNAEGKGLSISLLLPLTLSIIAGLSVKAGGQTFALSRTSIVEILSTTNSHVLIEEIGGTKMAKVRGKRYVYAKLETILGIEEHSTGWNNRSLVIIRPANGTVFAIDVEAVIDTEELVVKPCAPLIVATGLYAGTTLPDNGKPTLLLDASGLANAIGALHISSAVTMADVQEAIGAEVEAEDSLSVLQFEASDGVLRALPLSIIERMEDIVSDQIFQVSGRLVVNSNGKSHELVGITSKPEVDLVKVLRLSDGHSIKYLAINDVIDIFSVIPDFSFTTAASRDGGLVQINGVPIELVSPYNLFANDAEYAPIGQAPSLCYVEADEADVWERNILAPLLIASGYSVSFDPHDRDAASVILQSDKLTGEQADNRTIVLRDDVVPAPDAGRSIFRYDQQALMSEIHKTIAGRA
jgi:two-component system chemotaxis sensor kinase CheA